MIPAVSSAEIFATCDLKRGLDSPQPKNLALSHPQPVLVTARLQRRWSFPQILQWPDRFGGVVLRQVVYQLSFCQDLNA